MKQFHIPSLLALLTSNAFGQVPPVEKSVFGVEADRRLANLNKSQIPSGILYDRVIPLAQLYIFNQHTKPHTSSY